MLNSLKIKSFSAAFGATVALVCASSAFAFSYPTKWVMDNQSGSAINLSCEGETVGAGVIKDLRSLRVSARSSTTYTWSNFYFNDGLGLNEASWYCRDNASGTVFERFRTSWGEDVKLVFKRAGTKLTMTKY